MIIGKEATFKDVKVKITGEIIDKYRGFNGNVIVDFYIVMDRLGVIHHIPCKYLVSINFNAE